MADHRRGSRARRSVEKVRKAVNDRSWSLLSGRRDVRELLYPGQISEALAVDDFPVRLVWTQDMWIRLLSRLASRLPIAPPDYPGAQADLTVAIRRWLKATDTVLIVGSVSPWIEAIVYHEGCRKITTIDIAKIYSETDDLVALSYIEWEKRDAVPDIIISFSTVEHFGLGRYGDPVDPDADIKWMRDFALHNVKPGGVQLIAVPVAKFGSSSGAHRIYGPPRLRRLIEGWTFVEAIFQEHRLEHVPFSATFAGEDWQKQPVLVLRPKQMIDSGPNRDESTAEAGGNSGE